MHYGALTCSSAMLCSALSHNYNLVPSALVAADGKKSEASLGDIFSCPEFPVVNFDTMYGFLV